MIWVFACKLLLSWFHFISFLRMKCFLILFISETFIKSRYRIWRNCCHTQMHRGTQNMNKIFSSPADSSIGDSLRDLLKNTTIEWPQKLVTLETFDQGDEETWPDQKKDNDKNKDKDNDKDKYILRTPSKSDPRYLWLLGHLMRVMMRHDLTKDTWHGLWTWVKLLIIENLNSWQSLWPDNWEWHWTAFEILAMFQAALAAAALHFTLLSHSVGRWVAISN